MGFNPFQNKPRFLRVCSTSLLKTLWKKEKLLVTSNFSFPTVFSIRLKDFLPFSSNLNMSSTSSFSLEESIFCRLGKGYRLHSGIWTKTFCCLVQYSAPSRTSLQAISVYIIIQSVFRQNGIFFIDSDSILMKRMFYGSIILTCAAYMH